MSMDLLNLATSWAEAEVFTNTFFIAFGFLFILTSLALWRKGQSKLAKAYVLPLLVAGLLLTALGFALVDLYQSSLDSLIAKYHSNPSDFLALEIKRSAASIAQYKRDLFGVFPFVMMGTSLLLMFIKRPLWRAIFICILALSTVIMLVDSQAIALLEQYHATLTSLAK